MEKKELNDEALNAVTGGVREHYTRAGRTPRNRQDYTSAALLGSSENIQSPESTYRDADMAGEAVR